MPVISVFWQYEPCKPLLYPIYFNKDKEGEKTGIFKTPVITGPVINGAHCIKQETKQIYSTLQQEESPFFNNVT